MNKIISALLVGLLGFLGCSGSDAGTNAYTVQALGLVDGSGLSVSAYIMDQEENLSSDAMLTINGEPMNIGFSPSEDLNLEQGDNLIDAIDPTVQGVPSGVSQPYYFLDVLDLNEGDTMNFVAKGRNGNTLYSSSAVVPEKIRIIEPSDDEPLPAGEPVVVKWEGGAPCSQSHVIYYRGSDAEMFSSGMIQGSKEFIMPAHWIDEEWGVIFVEGVNCVDENDQKEKESGIEIRVEADIYIELFAGSRTIGATGSYSQISCQQKCKNTHVAQVAYCQRLKYRQVCLSGETQLHYGCMYRGCFHCT